MRSQLRGKLQPWRLGVAMLLVLVSASAMRWQAAWAAAPRQAIAPSSYLPTLLNRYCSGTRDASNPIGLQLYGPTGYGRPDFALLQETQSPWVRNHIDWYVVEPEDVAPVDYFWRTADRSLNAANHNCANMIVTIDGTPRWAATSHIHSPYRPEMEADFVQFIGAVVERYDGDGDADAPGSPVVNYWEFYNEPDGGPSALGDGWGRHPDAYAAMLKAAYPVIKAANPKAQVVFGGIAYDNFVEDGGIYVRDFLERVLEEGGGPYFDIMNIHYYPFHAHRTTWTKTKSSGLLEKVANVQALLAKRGLNKPLMITEVGWHSSGSTRSPSTDEFQSRYVVQLLTQAKAAGALSIIWWTFLDATDYPFKSGVATPGYDKKPAYAVYAEAVKRIGTAEDLRLLVEPTEEDDLEVFVSREAETGHTQYIVWLNPIAPFNAEAVASFDDGITTTWQTPGIRAEVYNKRGALTGIVTDGADGEEDGMLTFTVRTDPVYIVVIEPVTAQ